MPSFTRATHAQPSLSNFTQRDSDFGERACSRRTTRLEQKFPTSPQNKKTKLTHCSIYVPMRTISTQFSLSLVYLFVTSLLTHISINSEPFLVGIVSILEGTVNVPRDSEMTGGEANA